MEVVELSGPPGQLCAVSLFMIDPTLGIIGRGAGRLDHWITRRCCPRSQWARNTAPSSHRAVDIKQGRGK